MSEPIVKRVGLEAFTKLALAEVVSANYSWKGTGKSYRVPKARLFRRIIEQCFWTSL